MKKIQYSVIALIFTFSCVQKKSDQHADSTGQIKVPEGATTSAIPNSIDTTIWKTDLGKKLKPEYKPNPINQAEKDQNLILEYAVKNNLNIQRTNSGLYYFIETPGNGSNPSAGKMVTTKYRGYLLDGTEFDSSKNHGGSITFQLGEVIPAWDEALVMLKPGGKIKLLVPSALGYGEMGNPPVIPGNAVLGFDLELLGIR